jgi:hypothetical protein
VIIRFAGRDLDSRTTDRGGRAEFALPHASYQIVVEKRGYRAHVGRLDIRQDEVRMEITLHPLRR